jgi:hypothetical protein
VMAEPNVGCAPAREEDGIYRMMKLGSRKRPVVLDLRLCLDWRQSLCFVVSKKSTLNCSETLRPKTLSVSSHIGGLVTTHSHDKAADVKGTIFFRVCRDAAGREILGQEKTQPVSGSCGARGAKIG